MKNLSTKAPFAFGVEGQAILQPIVFDLEHMRR